jgi:hypothetical protein
MASPVKKTRAPAISALDYSTFALNWVAGAIGATYPVRFGLVLLGALGVQGFAKVLFAAVPSQVWLNAVAMLPAHQMMGITFLLFFAPLLLPRRRIPEETQSELALIEELVKKSGLSRAERQLVYMEILQASFKKGYRFSIVDIDAIRRLRETELAKSIEKIQSRVAS